MQDYSMVPLLTRTLTEYSELLFFIRVLYNLNVGCDGIFAIVHVQVCLREHACVWFLVLPTPSGASKGEFQSIISVTLWTPHYF
jgi:hypothetical protein